MQYQLNNLEKDYNELLNEVENNGLGDESARFLEEDIAELKTSPEAADDVFGPLIYLAFFATVFSVVSSPKK